jgi:hypothetical protein
VQLSALSQEMAESWSPKPAWGLFSVDHRCPSHRSTLLTVSPSESVTENPTAMHERADVHDTSSSAFSSPPRDAGRCIDQLRPLQRMASASPALSPSRRSPTAMQPLAAQHETPLRSPAVRRGAARTAHRRPFQRPMAAPPTAVQALEVGQDTA